jgi:glycosyltransferase involved in cell wall biosynthesis
MGVECIYAPYYRSVGEYLAERGDMFEHVVLVRIPVAEMVIEDVKAYAPSASKIFYTVDLHGLRELREAQLKNDPVKMEAARNTLQGELRVVAEADTSIVLSRHEADLLQERGHDNVAILPLIRSVPGCGPLGFDDRRDVVFIGGFQHTPNVDAARWLLDEIWPAVRRLVANRGLQPITLKIAGSKMPDWLADWKADDVVAVGFVEDLDALFDTARLSVAPLRYGAGLKGKLATSLGYGVPTVGTDISFEGMPQEGLDLIRVSENSAEGLAKAIIDLYFNEERWATISDAGPAYVARHFSVEVLTHRVQDILDRAAAVKATDAVCPYAMANMAPGMIGNLPSE